MNREEELSNFELLLWIVVRNKLRFMVAQKHSKANFLQEPGNSIICLVVRAHAKKYGFCSILRLLGDRSYKSWKEGKSDAKEIQKIRKQIVARKIRELRALILQRKREILRKAEGVRRNIELMKRNIRDQKKQIKLLWRQIRTLEKNDRKLKNKGSKLKTDKGPPKTLRKPDKILVPNWVEIHGTKKNILEFEKASRMMHKATKSPNLWPFLHDITNHCYIINNILYKIKELQEELRLLLKSKEQHAIPKLSARYYSSYSECPYQDFRCVKGFNRAAPVVVFLDLFTMPCDNDSRASLCSQYVRLCLSSCSGN